MITRPERTKGNGTWVYFAPVGEGGLAKYAVHQAAALSDAGARVVFLGCTHMRSALESIAPQIEFIALEEHQPRRGRIAKTLSWIRRLRRETRQLVDLTKQRDASYVLFASYAEYFSPFWVRPLVRLRRQGVRMGTVVHDPVRDFCIGPKIWHDYCVAQAYCFVDVAFLHDDTEIDFGFPQRKVHVEVIPHGPYRVPDPGTEHLRETVRKSFGIPSSAKVMLSFGHVRDGKNLDLAIRVLAKFANLHLLVVGREQSSSQRSIAEYRKLADQVGVADRCHWVNEFVADTAVHRYFHAADMLLLLYSADFRSASGVLSLASQFEIPVLASSGAGPLRRCVEKYELGIWVSPDDFEAVEVGLGQLIMSHNFDHQRSWDAFRRDHGWQKNAESVIHSLG